MTNLVDLPPELLSLIAQQIPETTTALAFCGASKYLQDATEADAWARQADIWARQAEGEKKKVSRTLADKTRAEALRNGRASLFRRLVTYAGIKPDMRDLALASYEDDHDLVDEILSYESFHASAADLPDDYDFQHESVQWYPWDFIGHPLANACYLGNMAMVRKLLAVPSIRASVNQAWNCPYSGYYPAIFGRAVHAAAVSLNPDVLRAVLDAGGDPNAVSKHENPPIILVFEFDGCPENAETLWLAGADMSPLRKDTRYVLRTAIYTCWQPADEFIPFIVHCATTAMPVTWILSVAVETRAYSLIKALLDADPRLLDTANALLLAYSKFPPWPQSKRQSLVFHPGRNKQCARCFAPDLHGRSYGPNELFKGYAFSRNCR